MLAPQGSLIVASYPVVADPVICPTSNSVAWLSLPLPRLLQPHRVLASPLAQLIDIFPKLTASLIDPD